MFDMVEGPYLTVEAAAERLRVSVAQMLAWNMVVIVEVEGVQCVPLWSVDPRVARNLPTLSEVFRGEALVCCLTHMRPFEDDRDGISALQGGHWRLVLERLRDVRRQYDAAIGATRGEQVVAMAKAHSAAAASIRLH